MASSVGDILLRFDAETGGLDRGTKSIKSFENQTISSTRKVTGASRTATNAIRALGAALAGLVSIRAAQSFLNTASSIQQVRIQIMAATTSVTQFNSVWRELTALALRTGVPLGVVGASFQTLSIAGRSLGFEATEVINILRSLFNITLLTGGSQQQLASSMLQVTQAAAQGVLRWEELKVILEQQPVLLDEIASSMGATTDELIRRARETGIPIVEIFAALLGGADEWGKRAGATAFTWELALGRIRTAYDLLISKIDEVLKIQARAVAGIDQIIRRTQEIDVGEVAGDVSRELQPLWRFITDVGLAFLAVAGSVWVVRKAIAALIAFGERGMNELQKAVYRNAQGVNKLRMAYVRLKDVGKEAMKAIGKAVKGLSSVLVILVGIVRAINHEFGLSIGIFETFLFISKSLVTALYALGGAFDIAAAAIEEMVLEIIFMFKYMYKILTFDWDGAMNEMEWRAREGGQRITDSFGNTRDAIKELWSDATKEAGANVETTKNMLKQVEELNKKLRGAQNGGNEPDPLKGFTGGLSARERVPEIAPVSRVVANQIAVRKKQLETFDDWHRGFVSFANSWQIDAAAHAANNEIRMLEKKHSDEIRAVVKHKEALARLNHERREQEKAIKEEKDPDQKKVLEEGLANLKQNIVNEKALLDASEENVVQAREARLAALENMEAAQDAALGRVLAGGLAEAQEHMKEFWLVQKGAMLAQAILDGHAAIAAAYRQGTQIGGPGLGTAYAAVATAAAAMNVAGVAGTTFSERRSGGQVEAGQMYRVGEAGAELFRMGNKQFMIPSEHGNVIPNNRLGMGGGNTVININNQTPSHISTRTTETPNGKQIDIMVREVGRQLAQGIGTGGSPLSKAMESRYGLSRARGGYN